MPSYDVPPAQGDRYSVREVEAPPWRLDARLDPFGKRSWIDQLEHPHEIREDVFLLLNRRDQVVIGAVRVVVLIRYQVEIVASDP